MTSITDGTSNTLRVGEKYIRPSSRWGKDEDRSVFGWNHRSFTRIAGVWHEIRANGNVIDHIDGLVPDDSQDGPLDENSRDCFGGPHSGVCLFVFCDGSVKALRKETGERQMLQDECSSLARRAQVTEDLAVASTPLLCLETKCPVEWQRAFLGNPWGRTVNAWHAESIKRP